MLSCGDKKLQNAQEFLVYTVPCQSFLKQPFLKSDGFSFCFVYFGPTGMMLKLENHINYLDWQNAGAMLQNVIQPSSFTSAGRNLPSNVPLGCILYFLSCSGEQWWGTEWSRPQLTLPAASPSCYCSLPIPSIDQADVIWITGHAWFSLDVLD